MQWNSMGKRSARLGSPASAESRFSCLVELRTCPPALGFARVEIPGEREDEMRAERLRHGIPIPPVTLESLRRLGRKLGVPTDELAVLAASEHG
jgi:LDH2 family malate/lactate/ureidoglycolate dehydrogenase